MNIALGAILAVSSTTCAWISGLDEFERIHGDRGSAGNAGGGGAGGGTPAGCIPNENSGTVPDSCGVWVSSSLGTDGNAGIQIAPAQTLKQAIKQATEEGTNRVYACAEEFPQEETLQMPAGVTIFGGLNCANGWGWIGAEKKSTIVGAADVVAVKMVAGDGTTRLEDVVVQAADGVTPGALSIAVLASAASVEIKRSELIAGNGADGSDGAPGAEPANPGDPVPPAQAGMSGSPGQNACTELGAGATVLGGAAVQSVCDGGETSVGGKGGDGTVMQGMNGEPGLTGMFGAPGVGEPESGTWSCGGNEPNGSGDIGEDGTPGEPGLGAADLGTLDPDLGIVGANGTPGTAGKPGQGGGGGGGAKGLLNCGGGQAGGGASGGSGGSGGCGGKPGQGGMAGGSSIALVSVDASVIVIDTTLRVGTGGRGGKGGDLQPGGSGGQPGLGGNGFSGSNPACSGGMGGKGGNGGPGGGGRGGHALALAYKGSRPLDTGLLTFAGTAGEGGLSGNENVAMNPGEAGIAATEQEF
jgi:hypothetical protein